MATIQSVKNKIQGLIDKSNEATGGSDTDLTSAVDSLIANQGGGGVDIDTLLTTGILGEIESDVTEVKSYALAHQSNITKLSLPLCQTIETRAFQECSLLEEINLPSCQTLKGYTFISCEILNRVNLPLCQTLGDSVFYSCKSLTEICLPNVESIGNQCFYACSALTFVDLPSIKSLPSQKLFQSCTNLKTLILRSETMVTLTYSVTNSYGMFGASSVSPYIYVPSALIDEYKATNQWAVRSSYFRALEDYTVDGTITGEFDKSKI